MKTSFKFRIAFATIFIIFIAAAMSSCTNISKQPVGNIIQEGSWQITYFWDKNKDETHHFTDYTFDFNSNGTVTATKGSSTISGTWSSGNDDSHKKLILDFGSQSPFDELNDDWHILEQTKTTLKLEDVSGGSGEVSYLDFRKK